ncbi:SRPBCC domain-containing protein [Acidicapsa dinghuensis]|uniref:SRPBCC domain-containing protein n=1 Tax=Acidicapsa dinghuensis TaxID=2218256 RepID=A0ABW1EJ76_9BACT|nr:SRPBCC domain-containing protein [Acidicapsa dinghuensis]
MSDHERYVPGPANGARVLKDGEKWTLVLVRDLRHSPEKVWTALTDPAHLREWAPFDADTHLDREGAVNLTWTGTSRVTAARVTRVEAPAVLEFHDIRWELEPLGRGTRLTLWHSIDHRYVVWGAAGWHICFDVLDRLLTDDPLGRIVGADAMKYEGWQQLTRQYADQFGATLPGDSSRAAQGNKQ